MNSTLSIDMSRSWTASDVEIRTIPNPGPKKVNVVLWTDSEAGVFYSWGGKWLFGSDMAETELWKFTADGGGGGTWSAQPPDNANRFDGLHPTEFGAFASAHNMGFAIGGLATGWTEFRRASTQAIPGMLEFNMETKRWQNGTTGFSPFDTLVGASAQYIPAYGPNGLVMVMGGHVPSVVGSPHTASSPPISLENVTFFDPRTKRSHWQVTTGNVPPSPRTQFCTAGFQNSDGGYDM